MRKTASFILLVTLVFSSFGLNAQILQPVKWTFESKKTAPNTYDLIFKAKIDKGWHLYSQFLASDDGPVKTTFTFEQDKAYARKGIVQEKSKPTEKFEEMFNMKVKYFSNEAVFVQQVKLSSEIKQIKGSLNFMVCDDARCMPPEDVEFSFPVNYEEPSVPAKKDDGNNGKGSKEDEMPAGSFGFNIQNATGNTETAEIKKNGILEPVKWTFEAQKIDDKTYYLVFKGKIDKGWHIYGINAPKDDVHPLEIIINQDKNYAAEGKPEEISKAKIVFDPIFEKELPKYVVGAALKQKVRLSGAAENISGILTYSACDSSQCIPPVEEEFTISLKDAKLVSADEVNEEKGGLLRIFIEGFLGGMLALLTPCVFPMIPLTVSFFTKKGDNKAKGIGTAVLFGLFIILIYVGIGFLVTKLFGAATLNEMASSAVFNLAFFIIFFIFALSFLGAFDIKLPSSWATKADEQSEKGGLLGIFFMAFTLALVSFSCTGPIIGTLLVEAAVRGSYLGPITGMLGFSLALALPFTIFAISPSMMQSLPKSGGWLNSVKVVLGFLELALALKFLSAVDLAYHWNFLKREYFLVIWIIIFVLLGLYLIGKIRFNHDTELPFVTIPRLLFAILAFSFALYMVPGLWGAPVTLLSGLAPPSHYTEGTFGTGNRGGSGGVSSSAHEDTGNKKHADLFHCPHNLNCYFDYEEAMEVSKKLSKPLFVDFTGHACVNCRKMEDQVWSDPQVLKRLNEDFVIVSLYVDDKTDLSENEVYTSEFSGKKINTIGKKWSDFQATKFGTNSQPFYVILDHNGQQLTNKPAAYDPDIEKFINFLDEGKGSFKSSKTE